MPADLRTARNVRLATPSAAEIASAGRGQRAGRGANCSGFCVGNAARAARTSDRNDPRGPTEDTGWSDRGVLPGVVCGSERRPHQAGWSCGRRVRHTWDLARCGGDRGRLGLNGTRSKLRKILADPGITRIVVEQRDRLTRSVSNTWKQPCPRPVVTWRSHSVNYAGCNAKPRGAPEAASASKGSVRHGGVRPKPGSRSRMRRSQARAATGCTNSPPCSYANTVRLCWTTSTLPA